MAKKTRDHTPDNALDEFVELQQRADEARRQAMQMATEAQHRRNCLTEAAGRAAALGEQYQLEGKADKQYLRAWVNAMAAYRRELDAKGLLADLNEAPPNLKDDALQVWHVALTIFHLTGTDPTKAVTKLITLAPRHIAFQVAEWLRHDIRALVDGDYRAPYDTAFHPPSAKPLSPTTTASHGPDVSLAVAQDAVDLARAALEQRQSAEDDDVPPELVDGWEDLQPLQRRLLKHMVKRERDTIDNVEVAVWGKDIRINTFRTALSRANKFLTTRSYCRYLTSKNGSVYWT
jgi:hypothetical protein